MAIAGLWVQLFLALGWTVYVIYLPQLAAQAGLAKQWVPWLLLADQLIFAVMDWTMGTMADRMAGAVEKLANTVVFVTLLSCGAFILLPLVAPAGSPALLIAVTVIWSASSSALRAPPWVLIGRHTPGPAQPWASALFLLGVGIAGAVAPYLAVTLRNADPRLPFALSSIALAVATVVMTRAIRSNPNPAPREPQAGDPLRGKPVVLFLAAVALLGLGFQVHFALNAAPNFLRFAKPARSRVPHAGVLDRLQPADPARLLRDEAARGHGDDGSRLGRRRTCCGDGLDGRARCRCWSPRSSSPAPGGGA